MRKFIYPVAVRVCIVSWLAAVALVAIIDPRFAALYLLKWKHEDRPQ